MDISLNYSEEVKSTYDLNMLTTSTTLVHTQFFTIIWQHTSYLWTGITAAVYGVKVENGSKQYFQFLFKVFTLVSVPLQSLQQSAPSGSPDLTAGTYNNNNNVPPDSLVCCGGCYPIFGLNASFCASLASNPGNITDSALILGQAESPRILFFCNIQRICLFHHQSTSIEAQKGLYPL